MQILAYILGFGLAFDVSFFLRRELVCTAHARTVQYSAQWGTTRIYRGRCNVNNVMNTPRMSLLSLWWPVYRGRILRPVQPSENVSGPCPVWQQLSWSGTKHEFIIKWCDIAHRAKMIHQLVIWYQWRFDIFEENLFELFPWCYSCDIVITLTPSLVLCFWFYWRAHITKCSSRHAPGRPAGTEFHWMWIREYFL